MPSTAASGKDHRQEDAAGDAIEDDDDDAV